MIQTNTTRTVFRIEGSPWALSAEHGYLPASYFASVLSISVPFASVRDTDPVLTPYLDAMQAESMHAFALHRVGDFYIKAKPFSRLAFVLHASPRAARPFYMWHGGSAVSIDLYTPEKCRTRRALFGRPVQHVQDYLDPLQTAFLYKIVYDTIRLPFTGKRSFDFARFLTEHATPVTGEAHA